MKSEKDRKFVETVWSYYKKHGRDTLPWRQTTDPYRIVVSEIMLQQTQVDRVLPKYKSFIKKWGTAKKLAAAPLAEVLIEWQGLGYNRRARMLHQCAKTVVAQGNMWPKTQKTLMNLPGIGHYTSGAVLAFAFNQAVAILETNIRTVYIHHYFKDSAAVSDIDLLAVVERTLDANNPREWYWALMDYGSHLKKVHGNLTTQSKHYTKQSKFKGSDREVRGAIIRALSSGQLSLSKLSTLPFGKAKIIDQLNKLVSEGMVQKKPRNVFSLPN